jgi:fructokinase
LVAGIELGGTKSLAVLVEGTTIHRRLRVPTTTPADTLGALTEELDRWRVEGLVPAALGIGSFGPVVVDRRRRDFGRITTTPKPGWRDTDVLGHFATRCDVPIGFDSDVVGAALAEGRWGASQGCTVHLYLTVGTGIGGGVVVDGRPLHGLVHPEIGHLRVRRRLDDPFGGACPFHGDCIEGLAAGPAIAARAGAPAESLGPEHPVWDDVTAELGELLALVVLTVSPERIVVGGGVGCGIPWLLPAVRPRVGGLLAGYVAGLDDAALEQLIVPPSLGDDAGPLGAAAIALSALEC